MYEGRTRGKRIKYTFSDEEDEGYSDATATTSRRSARNTGTHTPAEGFAVPTVTLSGRQVKSRHGGAYGESLLSETHAPAAIGVGGYDGISEGQDASEEDAGGRPRRAAAKKAGSNGWSKGGAHIEGYNSVDEMDDDEEEDASEQDYGDDDEDDDVVPLESDVDDPEELTDEEAPEDVPEEEKKSLIIKLPVKSVSPESKSTIKLRFTPEESRSKSPAGPKGIDASATSDTISSAKENLPSTSLSNTENPIQESIVSPIDIPSKLAPSPLSPSLTFRGSPKKAHAFQSPASINVLSGGP